MSLVLSLYLIAPVDGVKAEERPWGVITPMGRISTEQSGYQGRYNPWESESSMQIEETPARVQNQNQNQKRIRQGWQNIYQPRPTDDSEIWPETDNTPRKGDDTSQKRMFGDKSLNDEEQWPQRPEVRKPYRSMDQSQQFRTPFSNFYPNVPRPPYAPLGGYYPSGPRY